jgi:hypothetical protein
MGKGRFRVADYDTATAKAEGMRMIWGTSIRLSADRASETEQRETALALEGLTGQRFRRLETGKGEAGRDGATPNT